MTRFLRNVWYMAGWSGELTDGLLTRRIAGRARVFFRLADGTVAALHDRCPHRFAPLSRGERAGDALVCPYHGLTFDAGGQCIRNPFSERIPAGAQVDSWACAERDGIIWMWGGNADTADPAEIPDFSRLADQPGRKVLRGHTLVRAPYEFCTDNLMDLSHIEFVHRGTFAGDGVIFAGQHRVIDDGATLHSNWWMPGVPAPLPTRPPFAEGQLTDHWLDMRWNAPASMELDIGATLPGRPREEGFRVGGQAHIVTPESTTTAHYFTANARHEAVDDPAVDAFLTELFDQAFNAEDKPIIEAAFANLEGQDFWEGRPLSLGIDQGGTRARRKIQAMLAAEDRNG
ncbi:MAG: aromatic ring-hydroxylating dioxygenase subunit alpha [Proteobacteria bacterium]|nr:aromatic ring-hydroxylating dioxygenase subunit alpha [Pseudomonadota bacterium]